MLGRGRAGFESVRYLVTEFGLNEISWLNVPMSSIMRKGWDTEIRGIDVWVHERRGFTPPSRSEGCETPQRKGNDFYVDYQRRRVFQRGPRLG